MRADITYRTTFRYSEKVTESQNQVRACPASDATQDLHAYRIDTSPRARMLRYTDAWGTHVDAFGVRAPHDLLVVDVAASVETHPAPGITTAAPLATVEGAGFVDWHWEYLQPTRHTTIAPEVHDVARSCVDRARTVHDAVACLAEWVNTELTYAPGATAIGVTIAEVLERRSGVCQDFSHLLVALCRGAGIPARYVSGYFFAASDAAPADDVDVHTVEVQTHAWVEVAVPGAGWWPVDPTNLTPVGERHITIGRGREYDDVPPLRGAYTGSAEAEVTATVTIRRQDTGHHPAYTSDEVIQAFPASMAVDPPRGASDQ